MSNGTKLCKYFWENIKNVPKKMGVGKIMRHLKKIYSEIFCYM